MVAATSERDDTSRASADVSDGEALSLGEQVRAFRELRGLTVRQLAANLGLSPGFISQLENGRTGASLATLKRIAHALGVTLAELVEFSHLAHRGVVRKPDRTAVGSEGGVTKYVITKPPLQHIEAYVVEFAEGASSGDVYSAGNSQELVLVLKGRLAVILGDDVFELNEGDSIEFSSKTPHAIRNVHTGESEAMWTVSPPLNW